MTNKELLYVEDAVNHELNVIAYLKDSMKKLDNKSLKAFFEEEVNSHREYLNELLNEMEMLSNE